MNALLDNGFIEVIPLTAQARRFFEARLGDAIVSPLVRQHWTHELLNLVGTEREA